MLRLLFGSRTHNSKEVQSPKNCFMNKNLQPFLQGGGFCGLVLVGYYCTSTFFENIALPAFNFTTYTPLASPCVEML